MNKILIGIIIVIIFIAGGGYLLIHNTKKIPQPRLQNSQLQANVQSQAQNTSQQNQSSAGQTGSSTFSNQQTGTSSQQNQQLPQINPQKPVTNNQGNASQKKTTAPLLNNPLPNGDNHTKGKIVQISIKNFSFIPATLTVGRDTTIEWTNNDTVIHTIASASNIFGSAALKPGETYTFIATTRGTFDYYCSIHPGMTGKIIVQ